MNLFVIFFKLNHKICDSVFAELANLRTIKELISNVDSVTDPVSHQFPDGRKLKLRWSEITGVPR
jgi:hypothetical protein